MVFNEKKIVHHEFSRSFQFPCILYIFRVFVIPKIRFAPQALSCRAGFGLAVYSAAAAVLPLGRAVAAVRGAAVVLLAQGILVAQRGGREQGQAEKFVIHSHVSSKKPPQKAAFLMIAPLWLYSPVNLPTKRMMPDDSSRMT